MDYIQQPEAAKTAVEYAQAVLNGTKVAGKLVKKACERFLDDLRHGEDRGIYFDHEAAQHVVDFFGFLRHTKGVWARQVETSGFLLSDWQVFILTNLFGWKKVADGSRRFREAYLEVARKNGKSTFIAGIGLYMLFADGEPGAEIFSAATTKEQAKIVFNAAKDMVKVSPFLASRIKSWRNNLNVDATSSKFEPLAAESNTLDGLNIHCGLIDELHEHPDRSLYDVLNTATGSRNQPLIICITTAGFTREGICWDQRNHGVKVVGRTIEDDNFFAYIATMDDGDDWREEKNWAKANPNLGVSVSAEAIRPNFLKAKEQPAAQNEFLRKHLNVWTSTNTAMLVDGAWEKCCAAGEFADPVKERDLALEKLKGRKCFLGLDMASTDDLVALAAVFPPCETMSMPEIPAGHDFFRMGTGEIKCLPEANIQNLIRLHAGARTAEMPPEWKEDPKRFKVIQQQDKLWSILLWFWMPEHFLDEKEKGNRVPYKAWVRNKFIETCPGMQIDQQQIRNRILELNRTYRIGEIGYDLWNTGWLGPKLIEDGLLAVKVPQRFEFLDQPTKQFVNFASGPILEHFNNPVMKWMVSNVQLLMDSNGNQRPDKGKSKAKIDGVVATIMAIGRALANPIQPGDEHPDKYKVRYL